MNFLGLPPAFWRLWITHLDQHTRHVHGQSGLAHHKVHTGRAYRQ